MAIRKLRRLMQHFWNRLDWVMSGQGGRAAAQVRILQHDATHSLRRGIIGDSCGLQWVEPVPARHLVGERHFGMEAAFLVSHESVIASF